MVLQIAYGELTGLMLTGYTGLKLTGWHCPKEVELQKDFDIQQYLGRWFEFERKSDLSFETGECVYVEYSEKLDGSVRVYNAQYLIEEDMYDAVTGKA